MALLRSGKLLWAPCAEIRRPAVAHDELTQAHDDVPRTHCREFERVLVDVADAQNKPVVLARQNPQKNGCQVETVSPTAKGAFVPLARLRRDVEHAPTTKVALEPLREPLDQPGRELHLAQPTDELAIPGVPVFVGVAPRRRARRHSDQFRKPLRRRNGDEKDIHFAKLAHRRAYVLLRAVTEGRPGPTLRRAASH